MVLPQVELVSAYAYEKVSILHQKTYWKPSYEVKTEFLIAC